MAEKKATKTANPAVKTADCEAAVLAKFAAMPAPYRAMGERLHTLILPSASALQPISWYAMPAYAKDGKVICLFRADKYMTSALAKRRTTPSRRTRRISSANPHGSSPRWTTPPRPSSARSCAGPRAEDGPHGTAHAKPKVRSGE